MIGSEEQPCAGWRAEEGRWLSPGFWAGLAEWSLMHPSGTRPGAGAMAVTPGTGLLSQVIERGMVGSCGNASSPGAWRPPPGLVTAAAGGVGEQVIGAGKQLAGDRGGGDLLAAASRDGLVAGGELG